MVRYLITLNSVSFGSNLVNFMIATENINNLFDNSFSFFRMGDKKKSELNGFQIMSFNARLFNHYRWIENDSIPFATENFFKKNIPDVLSIQEYHGDYEYLLNNYKNIYF